MTITVGTDSYVSVADADAYFAARNVTAWPAASVAVREAALLQATVYLDGTYRFIGRISDVEQALAWPRIGAIDADGRSIDGIPTRLAHACAELALIALAGDLAPPEIRGGKVLQETVGPLSIRYAEGAPVGRTFPYVDLLLAGLTELGGTSQEVSRS